MSQVVWITDPHFNFLGSHGGSLAGKQLRKTYPSLSAVVLTGDLAEFKSFPGALKSFAAGVDAPVWFVLGNHDSYGGSVHGARTRAAAMGGRARWLTGAGIVAFGDTALVGQDGWYDGRCGDALGTSVYLSDFDYVKELRGLHRVRVVEVCQEIADADAKAAEEKLEEAVAKGFKRIVLATHVAPFQGASWHKGAISNSQWLPWFASKAMGDAILRVAYANPDISFLVLCGHSHSPGVFEPADNVKVLTGDAEYCEIRIAGVFDWT